MVKSMIKSRIKTAGIGIEYRFSRDTFGNVWFLTEDPSYKPAIVLEIAGLSYKRSAIPFPIDVVQAARDFAYAHSQKGIKEYPKHDLLHRPVNSDGSYKKRVKNRVKTRLVLQDGAIVPKKTKTIDLSR